MMIYDRRVFWENVGACAAGWRFFGRRHIANDTYLKKFKVKAIRVSYGFRYSIYYDGNLNIALNTIRRVSHLLRQEKNNSFIL